MNELNLKSMELSKTDSKVERFVNILKWCEQNSEKLPSFCGEKGVYVALDENVQIHPKMFEIVQGHNKEDGVYVSPIIATENMNYVLIRVSGENFLMDQLTGLTCVLLELNSVYKQIQLRAVEVDENESSWVIGFYGLTNQ